MNKVRKGGRITKRTGRGAERLLAAAAVIFTLMLFLAGCEWFLGPEPAAPENLTATTGEADKIELSWEEVEKADVYYIYRADTEEDEYEYHAFSYGPVYTDTKIAYERSYFYKVTAADMETNNESPRSEPAEGSSTHEYGWSGTIIAAAGAAQQRLALDKTDPADGSEAGGVYLAAAADDATGAVSVYKYDRDAGSWTALGEPFGTTDTAEFRVLDICAGGGEVYAAYSDKGLGGKVTVRKYNETDEIWDIYPSAADEGFSSGTNARYLSMDIDSAGVVYVGYMDSGGAYINRSSDNFTADLSPPNFSLDDSSVVIDIAGSNTYAAFEDEGTDIKAAGITVDGTGGQNLRNNYLDFTAVASSEMYIAYYTDALYVKKYNGSDWNSDITPADINASGSAASVAVAYDNPAGTDDGTLYLFYRDALSGGIVKKYNGSPAAWQTMSIDEETDQIALTPAALELEAYNNFIYASYLTGGAAQMRIWE